MHTEQRPLILIAEFLIFIVILAGLTGLAVALEIRKLYAIVP